MKREEALSLLQDLMVACESMRFATVVSLTPTFSNGDWTLNVKWDNTDSTGYLEKIVHARGLRATVTADGYTVFRTLDLSRTEH